MMISLNGRLVTFTLHRQDARRISVAGDFNDWSPSATLMRRIEPGQWRATLLLDPGAYRFRYLVDDEHWLTDYAAFGVQRNAFHGWDSVLYVTDGRAAASSIPRVLPIDEARRAAMKHAGLPRRWEFSGKVGLI